MELNIKDVLTRLDKTHYKAWVKESAPRGYVSGDIPVDILVELIEAYRAALSQPQGEPVAWLMVTPQQGSRIFTEDAEKVARFHAMDDRSITPLFTAPPAQPNTSSKEAALLTNAIVQAAIKRGIVNADVGDLTGPQVMHLVDYLADLPQPVRPVPLSDEKIAENLEAAAKVIYQSFWREVGFKPWQDGRNSHMQDKARVIARSVLTTQEAK